MVEESSPLYSHLLHIQKVPNFFHNSFYRERYVGTPCQWCSQNMHLNRDNKVKAHRKLELLIFFLSLTEAFYDTKLFAESLH